MEIYNVYMYSNRDVVTLRLIFNCQLTTPAAERPRWTLIFTIEFMTQFKF